jgi:hypothetical protein
MKEIGEAPKLEKGMYRHRKGGMYEVLDVVCYSETLEWHVLYESQDRKAQGLPALWVRPYDMFFEMVEVDGVTVPRFKKID